jgi:pimeloyl-ACP methyl ester carboxylesterase
MDATLPGERRRVVLDALEVARPTWVRFFAVADASRPFPFRRRFPMTTPATDETWIETPRGRLYAKRWRVSAAVAAAGDARCPIVLLHDSLGCVELWRDFPARLALATRRDVIAYDRLGFGRSDRHPGALETSFVRDEAAHGFDMLRTQLGLDAFVVFGHSVGGGMAVGCAARFPDACRALVTESAQAFVEDRTLAGIRDAARRFAEPTQIERLARYHGDKAEWVLRAWVETWLSPAFRDWHLGDVLAQVRCPTLVIHGEHDEYGSPSHPDRIAARVGGPSTVEIVRDCGHVPHREHQGVVLERVGAFLRALRA